MTHIKNGQRTWTDISLEKIRGFPGGSVVKNPSKPNAPQHPHPNSSQIVPPLSQPLVLASNFAPFPAATEAGSTGDRLITILSIPLPTTRQSSFRGLIQIYIFSVHKKYSWEVSWLSAD